MLAACILFALPTIKETWVRADTHPVYNSRVQTIPMLGYRKAELYMSSSEFLKSEVIWDCVRYWKKIDETDHLLALEAAMTEPDPRATEVLLKIRARYIEQLNRYAGVLKGYPEWEKQIQEERLKLKQQKP
jgi:hypothetical protein